MNMLNQQISDLQIGKEAALSFFMDRHAADLNFFAYKIIKNKQICSEVVSDAFVKLWERRASFHAHETIKSFLYLVVRNDCLDHLKQYRNKYPHDEAFLEDLKCSNQDILTEIIYTELLALIVQEVEKLPKQQAKILQLSVFEGYSTQEICEQLGTTSNTVYFARSKAVATLKKVFQQKHLSFHHVLLLLALWP